VIRVKICGITNWADARAAVEAGADALGFNFYEKSLRRVSTADAAQMRAKLPSSIQAVGVFVNAKPAEILSLRAFVRFDTAQLHGDETPAAVSQVVQVLPVIKAFRLEANFSLAKLDEYPDVFAYLLDAARPDQYGGTGQLTDWAAAARAALSRRIILSGGLNVGNVAAAIRAVHPFAVDVASGVETRPGKKDHSKLQEFIQQVRRAEQEQVQQAENHTQA